MTERNQCGCADEALGMDATSGVTPPLLPTLFMAVVLGAASFVCREPAAPAPPPTTAISTTLAPRIASEAASVVAEAAPAAAFVPAALAFPRQFPLVVTAQVAAPMPAVAQHRPAASPATPHLASLRRAGPAKARSAETRSVETPAAEAPRADPARAMTQAEAPASVAVQDGLPDLALPFAPAIQALGRARDFVGVQGAAARTQATALGGAVVEFVGTLR